MTINERERERQKERVVMEMDVGPWVIAGIRWEGGGGGGGWTHSNMSFLSSSISLCEFSGKEWNSNPRQSVLARLALTGQADKARATGQPGHKATKSLAWADKVLPRARPLNILQSVFVNSLSKDVKLKCFHFGSCANIPQSKNISLSPETITLDTITSPIHFRSVCSRENAARLHHCRFCSPACSAGRALCVLRSHRHYSVHGHIFTINDT